MNYKLIGSSLAVAMILAGCGTTMDPMGVPVTDASLDSVDFAFQGNQGYAVAALDENVTIKGCEASSTRSTFFQGGYAIDGNLHSAWAPAATDAAPSLVLTLPAVQRLTRVSLKQSHTAVTVDVAVSKGGGAWQQVATGLAPVATTLSDLDLTSCEGDRVKLTFHGQGLADLQVCEVQLGCTAATSPSPSPVPSTSPSTLPVPVPVPTPTPVPPSPPCTVTGGGWLPSPDRDRDHEVCFAFLINLDGSKCDGTIDVDDLTATTKFHGTVTGAACRGNLVTFTGLLDDGQTFTATVVDEGKHGRTDTISFATSGGTLFCGALEADQDLGGRIRIRQQVDLVDLVQIGVRWKEEARGHKRFELDDYEARCREAAKQKKRHGKGKGKGHGDN